MASLIKRVSSCISVVCSETSDQHVILFHRFTHFGGMGQDEEIRSLMTVQYVKVNTLKHGKRIIEDHWKSPYRDKAAPLVFVL